MPKYILMPSKAKNKKWTIITPDEKIIHFGDSRYSDYTINKDPKRKEAYLSRHGAEDWRDLTKPAAYSRWLLWSEPSLSEAIKKMNKEFNIHIVRKRS